MFAAVAGIYVHIPFCRKACHYCNFHFSTSFRHKDELIEAILAEAVLQRHYLGEAVISSIYFGGGTPSALPAEDIDRIMQQLKSGYHIRPDAEVTLEVNPDDVQMTMLNAWKLSGVNRLSLGIQALQDDVLKEWNRTHTADQARMSIKLAREAGYHNISADLIYGGPGLNDEDWRYNISYFIESGIQHISAYALTVEKGTVLAHRIEKGKCPAPDDEQSSRQYGILQEILRDAGYEQYEISNFAMPGFYSQHNTGYWSGEHYLGLGPSAHSFDGVSRQWNVANNVKYRHALDHGKIPFEREELTIAQRYNELVMTGLRTNKGIDKQQIKDLDQGLSEHLERAVTSFIQKGQIELTSDRLLLKPEYYFFADGIASALFYVGK